MTATVILEVIVAIIVTSTDILEVIVAIIFRTYLLYFAVAILAQLPFARASTAHERRFVMAAAEPARPALRADAATDVPVWLAAVPDGAMRYGHRASRKRRCAWGN